MVSDHVNYLTFEDPGAVNTVRRALKLAHAGDLHGAAETAGVDVAHAQVVSEALQRGMRFSIGAEMDNDPRSRPDAQNIVEAMRPDGIIRSVNFVTIDHPEKGADWAWAFDNAEFAQLHEVVGTQRLWELYVAKLFDDLEKLPANVVGHFYAPAYLGGWPARERLEEYEDRLLTICHSRGLAVEINTRFLYRDNPQELKQAYLDANTRLARKAKALGVGIAIGSDAHSPRDQGNAFDAALRILDDAHVNELVFPVAARLARVALRATREHLEAQAKSTEVSTPGSSITGFSRAELGLPEQAEASLTRRESSRAAREAAAKKRATGPTRVPKRTSGAKAPSVRSAQRTAESSSSSNKAKDARVAKPASAKKPAAAKTKHEAVAKRKKPTAAAKKSAAARKPAKPPSKSKPAAAKSSRAKRPASKKTTRTAAPRKATAPKARAKKAAVKKAAPRRSVIKKSSPKKPAMKRGAKKSAAKPPVKSKAAKKKPATKRR